MKVALLGQPNCGKSTIFNAVAGYRSATGNFPGTTVELAWSKVRLNGVVIELVDLPGIYSLTASSPAESVAKRFLLEQDADLVIHVMDASTLSRSLELTLELRELGIPMVVCLNMMDEASRKGISISAPKLAELLGLPVVETVASRGEGIRELFAQVKNLVGPVIPAPRRSEALGRTAQAGIHAGQAGVPTGDLSWHKDVETAVTTMQDRLNGNLRGWRVPARFVAVKLLEGDEEILAEASPQVRAVAMEVRQALEHSHGRPAESVIMSERHDRSMHLFEQAATLSRPKPDIRIALDSLLMHSFWGYPILLAILGGFFWAVFGVGSILETALTGGFETAFHSLAFGLVPNTLSYTIVRGVWDGFAGGVGIVLPYLVPFLIGLAILEDIGYLPRVAYLMDGLLHRVGLHGTSMLPLILGYGCSVPACLATRILPSRRDRFLASVLSILVPCSARSTVIFALVAFYLGPAWALAIYAFNGLVVVFSGWLLARVWPEISAGMILEVPNYHWPTLHVVIMKTWLRLREFVVIGLPLLVVGSLALGLMSHWRLDAIVNEAWAPLASLLGLPVILGTILIFGILRKELTLVMLVQVLGTTHVTSMVTPAQLLIFTVFVTFYFPCVATLGALLKEVGGKLTLLAVTYTTILAVGLSIAVRLLTSLIPVI
jgi:ferrous iron transport protein B